MDKYYSLIEADHKHKDILTNLYNLYSYDISEYTDQCIQNDRAFFEFEDIDEFLNEDLLSAKILYCDGLPIGFLLMGESEKYAIDNCDYIVYDLFVMKGYRGKKAASYVLKEIFGKYKGNYCISELRKNEASLKFWEIVIKKFGKDKYSEILETPAGDKYILKVFEVL